jgi:putative endonuclease
MKHYVYIIQSVSKEIYYKGYSLNPLGRLRQHNNNESRFTSHKGPWVLIFIQSYSTKKEALIRERKLKKYSKRQIVNLIKSRLNELS